MSKPLVNFVVSKDKKSKIFVDLFRRYVESPKLNVVVSEAPLPNCDVYHYHRAHLAENILSNSVITVHHDLDDIDPSISIDKFLPKFEKAKCVICLNSIQERRLAENSIGNTIIIPHGFDDTVFSKKQSRRTHEQQKLTLGIVSKRYARRVKGEAYLFQLLDRLDPDQVAFNLCGPGRLTDAIHMRSLGYDVKIREHLPYHLYQNLYEEIDVLLILSSFEGGPANIPEAIGTGTPIVTTRVGMAADMVYSGINGLFLEGDVDKDAKNILALSRNDDGLFDKLQRGAIETTNCPTWGNVIDQHLKLYNKIKT